MRKDLKTIDFGGRGGGLFSWNPPKIGLAPVALNCQRVEGSQLYTQLQDSQ